MAGAALLMLLWAIAPLAPARADDNDPYAATVKVDATADTVIKARETARVDGQRRALTAVVERLANGAPVKLPKLDDNAITNLVASFAVADERMSAVRYVADYTFHFQPAGIRRLLGNAGIAANAAAASGAGAAATPQRPLVVLPVFREGGQAALWDDPNPWRDAWQKASSGAPLPVLVPLGDIEDMAAIDAAKASAGDAEGLAAIAKRNGGGDALVATAALRPGDAGPAGLDVTVRRYRDGQPADTHTESLTANPGESADDLLRRGATTTVAAIAHGWKDEAASGQQGTLTAVLPINSLGDWIEARQHLAGLPTIRKISLMALSRQEATIEIDYAGGVDQLKASLAGINLQLVQGGPLWHLARAAGTRVP